MANYNWNDGQLLTLNPGDTAICEGGLNSGQLYALFFYNSAVNDTDAYVTVVWKNGEPPVPVKVPGTTARQGLASLFFVSGTDTNTVSAAMTQSQPGAQVQCFICSVKMPTDTKGIHNKPLPPDGKPHPFTAFTRYYAVLQSHWYQLQLKSNVNQFIAVQFQTNFATVIVVNETTDPSPVIYSVGAASKQYKVDKTGQTTLPWPVQGNGEQTVWMNADSIQNSESATITLQSLSALYEPHQR